MMSDFRVGRGSKMKQKIERYKLKIVGHGR